MKAAAILKAREERGLEIEKLEKTYSRSVISVTVNIPGGKKADDDYSWIGLLAFNEISRRLSQGAIIHESFRESADGPEGFIVAKGKPEELKRFAMDIEESHPLGRLFDIDISGLNRNTNGGKRVCLLCGEAANMCRITGKHIMEELIKRIDKSIESWDSSIVDTAVESVSIAMHREVVATPKPGLVDKSNNGAHTDMNRGTFIRSINALTPYFREMAEVSVVWCGSPSDLFSELRPIGKRAEEAMLNSTGGVNTHKGQIFSLGLAVGAGCYLKRRGELSVESLSAAISSMLQGLSFLELKNKTKTITHGEKAYDAYGVTGIRGEAEKGFPVAFNVGLPVYREVMNSNFDENRASVKSLVSIMAVLDDSNVYRRGGPKAAEWVKKTAAALMEDSGVFIDSKLSVLKEFDREMIVRNISPGGAADMLALAIFVHKFMK